MPTNNTRIRLLIGLAVVVAAFAYLFLSGMEASQIYYLTVSEFNQRAAELEPGEPYRVSGRVQPGSIDLADNGLDLQFTLRGGRGGRPGLRRIRGSHAAGQVPVQIRGPGRRGRTTP